MTILFNDIIQYSNIAQELKSPILANYGSISSPLIITLDKSRQINAIGIGNTNGTEFSVQFNDPDNTIFTFTFSGNGLYPMEKTVTASQITVISNAVFAGRIGAGLGVNIPTSIAKEPAFNSTAEPRFTLSGQVIPGAGGYYYKTVSLDSRYKIAMEGLKEIEDGYIFIGMGYPFFIDLTCESYKLPFSKLYATEKDQLNMSFESGIHRGLFSRRFNFEERF